MNFKKNGVLYFRVGEGQTVRLDHAEHKTLNFDAGEYKVVRQREYRPDGWMRVRD